MKVTIRSKRKREEQLIRWANKPTGLDAMTEAEIGLGVAAGISDKAIMRRCSENYGSTVTHRQIYRISVRIGLRRYSYRNGDSPFVQFIMNKASAHIKKELKPRLLTEG